MKKLLASVCIAWASLTGLGGTASAAEITIGVLSEPAVDPHYLYLGTNIAFSRHMFDALTGRDEKGARIVPGLAESWKAIDDLTWEFKLRRGVKFHDGSEFTAEDVVFTVKRLPTIPNNPSPYTTNIPTVVGVEAVDNYTVRLKTNAPSPALPVTVGSIFIVSHKAAANATPGDFRSGKAAIGTGPFKFDSYTAGDRLVLKRNDDYWGKKPVWDKVTFRILANDSTRVAALLSGDVDLIDSINPADVARVKSDPQFKIFSGPSDRIIMLLPDSGRATTPFVSGKDGKPLPTNPLQDVRVRQALSHAIDRNQLVKQTMSNLASPASQYIPEIFPGYNASLKVDGYDPARARKLLAEAGYPNGFSMTIHGPNDRYVNDAKVIQAVAQMFAKIGLTMNAVALPKSTYFGKAKPPDGAYSMQLIGWGSAGSGDAVQVLSAVIHSYDSKKGFGAWNFGNYKNPDVDRAIEAAVTIMDADARDKALQKAMALAVHDYAAIPLHNQSSVAAARKGIVYVPRVDEQTVAMGASLDPSAK